MNHEHICDNASDSTDFICADPSHDDDGWPADPAYDAHLAELEKLCGATFTTGGHDPYSTECELERGHYPASAHVGDNPLGDGKVSWRGGGSAGGDALPYTQVTWNEQDRYAAEVQRRRNLGEI